MYNVWSLASSEYGGFIEGAHCELMDDCEDGSWIVGVHRHMKSGEEYDPNYRVWPEQVIIDQGLIDSTYDKGRIVRVFQYQQWGTKRPLPRGFIGTISQKQVGKSVIVRPKDASILARQSRDTVEVFSCCVRPYIHVFDH